MPEARVLNSITRDHPGAAHPGTSPSRLTPMTTLPLVVGLLEGAAGEERPLGHLGELQEVRGYWRSKATP